MIVETIFLVLRLLLTIIWLSLAGITYIIPTQIATAFTEIFSYIKLLDSIFPITTAVLAMLVVLSVLAIRYTIDFFMWIVSFIPMLNRAKHDLPKLRT